MTPIHFIIDCLRPIPNAPEDDGDTSFPRWPTLRPFSEIMCDPRNGGAGFKPTVVKVEAPEEAPAGESVDFIDAVGLAGKGTSGGRRDEQYPAYDWGALDEEELKEEEGKADETEEVEEEEVDERDPQPLKEEPVLTVTLQKLSYDLCIRDVICN